METKESCLVKNDTDSKIVRLSEVMVDIETLGTRPGSVVVSIAAAAFDGDGHVIDTFETKLSQSEQVKAGLKIDPDTVEWWFEQSEAARQKTFGGERTLTPWALAEFVKFIGRHNPMAIWAHGPQFDIVHLEFLFDAFGYKQPWSYKKIRDTRTMYDAAGVDLGSLPFEGTPHNALDDVIHQIGGLTLARSILHTRRTVH